MDWNSLDNSLFSIVFYILLDKPTYIKEQKVDEWINERPTSACVQPGGRFFNSNLLLCQCRRKLLTLFLQHFTAAPAEQQVRVKETTPGVHTS
jgi:hypothetical protein